MKKFLLIFIAILLTSSNGFSQNFWEKTNAPDTAVTNSIAVNSIGNVFIATDDGIFRSTDDGNNWLNLGINKGIRSIYITPGGTIYLTSKQQGSILRSTDNGSVWVPIGLTSWQNSIAVNANGHIFAGTDNFGIYRTTNNGANWVHINNGLTDPHITALIINSNQDIFAATILEGIFHSSDNGENWHPVNVGLTSSYITALAINSNGDIFAGTSGNGIFRSTNNGFSWIEINQGVTGENLWIRSILADTGDYIFAGTGGGVLQSVDNGENWININDGLINYDVRSLNKNSEEIFAGTSGGVFRRLNNTTSIGTSDTQILSFGLFQNYPNPFNPSTKIRFQIPNESKVVIKIYNILGAELMELLNEQKGPGVYEVEFNADKLTSGTYIYKLSTDNFTQTRKMILLR